MLLLATLSFNFLREVLLPTYSMSVFRLLFQMPKNPVVHLFEADDGVSVRPCAQQSHSQHLAVLLVVVEQPVTDAALCKGR